MPRIAREARNDVSTSCRINTPHLRGAMRSVVTLHSDRVVPKEMDMKKFFPVVLILPVLMLLPAVCVASDSTIVEEIVARVNNSIITSQDLNRARDQLVSEMHEKGINNDQAVASREKDLLRDLIDQQLLIQKAGDLGITGDTELVKRLDEIRKSLNLESMEDLEKAAQAQGVSYEEFKQNLRNGILTQAVIGREVGSRIQVTPEETQKYYDQHKSELERPEQVRLSEILIAPVKADPKQATSHEPAPEQLAAVEKKANDLLAELKKGAKFDEVAKKNSDGPTAAQGGDLGYFKRGTLAKELEDKTFSMKKDEMTDVIRTRQGFIILKVTEHDAAGIPPLKDKDVEAQVQEALYMEKLQPALRAYLTKLREEAYIDIKSNVTDTAASPNQTKPVMMATANEDLPKGKQTKKKKKFLIF